MSGQLNAVAAFSPGKDPGTPLVEGWEGGPQRRSGRFKGENSFSLMGTLQPVLTELI